jgi:hypothetical protein
MRGLREPTCGRRRRSGQQPGARRRHSRHRAWRRTWRRRWRRPRCCDWRSFGSHRRHCCGREHERMGADVAATALQHGLRTMHGDEGRQGSASAAALSATAALRLSAAASAALLSRRSAEQTRAFGFGPGGSLFYRKVYDCDGSLGIKLAAGSTGSGLNASAALRASARSPGDRADVSAAMRACDS